MSFYKLSPREQSDFGVGSLPTDQVVKRIAAEVADLKANGSAAAGKRWAGRRIFGPK